MPPTKDIVPFSQATAVTKLADNVYRVLLVQDYCAGAVPNGGYVASAILQAASQHLSHEGQPDTLSAQFQYINRTQVGDAIIVIETIKQGRAISTLHATLYQGERQEAAPFITPASRKLVLAYLINTCISRESGISLSTGWTLLPPPPPVDLRKLRGDTDPAWGSDASRIQLEHLAASGFVRAVEKAFQSYYPRVPGRKGLEDAWVCFANGERFTDASLPLVADAKPYVVEAWRPKDNEDYEAPFGRNDIFWYPTLAMNLDIKKSLPKEGVEWLFLRTMTRKVQNGRLDLQVMILDEEGDLVALASHVNMVLSASRNLAKRKSKEKL